MNLVDKYLSSDNIFKRFKLVLRNLELLELLPLLKEEELEKTLLNLSQFNSEWEILLLNKKKHHYRGIAKIKITDEFIKYLSKTHPTHKLINYKTANPMGGSGCFEVTTKEFFYLLDNNIMCIKETII